jgi:hypothetical protein
MPEGRPLPKEVEAEKQKNETVGSASKHGATRSPMHSDDPPTTKPVVEREQRERDKK